MDERLQKQLAFILEIDKEKNIFRRTHLSGNGRNENDAEHAWHMAVMAYLLQEYSNDKIDILKVIIMCLIHDVVEIDAGDTYAYDNEGLKTQKARKMRQKNESTLCCQKIRKRSLSRFLMSLKKNRRRKQNLHTRWIICASPAQQQQRGRRLEGAQGYFFTGICKTVQDKRRIRNTISSHRQNHPG